jgi:hypothetical protein
MKKGQAESRLAGEMLIFERLLRNGHGDLNADLARYLLTLGFGDEEKARMHELAVRNQEGAATPAEVEELLDFANAGFLLGIPHAKARKALKKKRDGSNKPAKATQI